MSAGDFLLILILAALGSLIGLVFGAWCLRGLGELHALWDDRQWRKENAARMPQVLKRDKEGSK